LGISIKRRNMSITLSNAAVVSIGGSTVESDANSAATYMEVSFPNIIRLYFDYGTTAGQVFTPGVRVGRVIVSIDLVTGIWSGSNGTSGTLVGAALTNLQATVKGWRNAAETFAVNQNVLPGSQVAWT
jgi:hypothetical protein